MPFLTMKQTLTRHVGYTNQIVTNNHTGKISITDGVVKFELELKKNPLTPSPCSFYARMKATKVNDLIEVKHSPRGGLGIFASRTIASGTMLLKEEPLLVANSETTVLEKYAMLVPQQQREFNDLHWWWERSPDPILGRFKTNEFGLGTDGKVRCGAVAYMISRFNHDCDPSAKVTWESESEGNGGGGYLRVDTVRDIGKGEEITICYTTERENLYPDYGFSCKCICHHEEDAHRDSW